MAFQDVKIPRFYCNVIDWLYSINEPSIKEFFKFNDGISSSLKKYGWYNTLPSSSKFTAYDVRFSMPTNTFVEVHQNIFNENSFLMCLGHNFFTYPTGLGFYRNGPGSDPFDGTPLVNDCSLGLPAYDGWSLTQYSISPDEDYFVLTNAVTPGAEDWDISNQNLQIATLSSVILGTFYDMPNSPNLSLTMGREYDTAKEFTTYMGGTISNTMWSAPPQWGDNGAW